MSICRAPCGTIQSVSLTESFTPLPSPVPGLFFPKPSEFLIDDVIAFKALCAVKTNKSSGPNPFPCRIWKDFAVELAPVVRDIYNASLVQGFIPSQLKQSIISPLPKCSPPKDIKADLRHIALTSQFSKVLEGFTCRFLYDHVVDLIDDKQFALSGKSTTHMSSWKVLTGGICMQGCCLLIFPKGLT